jgi:protein TonB
VLRLSSTLPEGQGLIISNAQGRDVVCRVVHARNLPAVKGYVEVAFVEPVNDFWAIHRPLGQTNAALPHSPAALASQVVPSEPVIAPTAAPRAADTPDETNEAPGNGPTFDDIAGLVRMSPLPSQVRRPSGTASQTASLVHDKEFAPGLAEPSKPATQAHTAGPATISKSPAAAARGITSASREASPSVSDNFMSRGMLDPGKGLAMPAMSEPRGKMPLIIGGALVLLVGIGAGAFFFHQGSAPSPSSLAPAAQALSLPPASTPDAPSGATQSAAAQLTPDQPVASVSSETVSTPAASGPSASLAAPVVPSRGAKNSDANQPDRPAVPRQAIPNLKMSRPTAAKRNAAIIGDASPSSVPDVVSNIGGAPAGGLLSSTSRAPAAPAPPPSSGPMPMVDPKVISTVRPDYPQVAKQAKIQGVVVIDAEIEVNGKVGAAVATSGPAVLRESATAAVKQWKYQPAQMNGKPVSTHVTVSVNFRLQ